MTARAPAVLCRHSSVGRPVLLGRLASGDSPQLAFVAPGKLLAVPSNSTHLIIASLVSGASFSITNCSIHWLEFIIILAGDFVLRAPVPKLLSVHACEREAKPWEMIAEAHDWRR